MTYVTRTLEPVVRRAAEQFPVVVLTGPRQSGKTTLLQHVFGDTHQYVAVDLPDVRAAARDDPRGFLDGLAGPVIIDEIQAAPELLPYIRARVDADRTRAGRYLLTGSGNLLLAQGVTESLAGRAAMLKLWPLSDRELAGTPQAGLPWDEPEHRPAAPRALEPLWARLLRGGYPEPATDPTRDVALWHASYVQTYLERDVRSLRQVGDLTQFQAFLRALAARSAQLLNMAGLARDLGLAVNTVKAWISVLEASCQVVVLRPYFANISKRLVKTPKVYFADVGTLCHLTGLSDPEHARRGPMAGAIFETAVVGEVLRASTHLGREPNLYFWRTGTGVEVDLLVDRGTVLTPLEMKTSATPNRKMAAGIAALRRDLGARVDQGYVVHPGDTTLPLGPGAEALPFSKL